MSLRLQVVKVLVAPGALGWSRHRLLVRGVVVVAEAFEAGGLVKAAREWLRLPRYRPDPEA